MIISVTSKMGRLALFIFYGIMLLALYPIAEYEFHLRTIETETVTTFSYVLRLVFSGPLLILAGILMFWSCKGIHRLFGGIAALIGIYWLSLVLRDLLSF